MSETVRLSTAQALVRWMAAQRSELLDGTEVALFPGVFAIFGHGNVLGLGTALHEVQDTLPTYRGNTEQGMALAAVAYSRAVDRRQVMTATASIGPGSLNMVTAAGVAHANRLPLLLLLGDTFVSRAPDPVLQQLEDFQDATLTANDAFRAVTRYYDRIVSPEQLIASLPQVLCTLTDPELCGPVALALPQDVQALEHDFPVELFDVRHHRVPRPRPDLREVQDAAAVLRAARRPLLVIGGGARYSGAGPQLHAFSALHGVPVVDTPAGRSLVGHEHPLYAGPLGIIGSSSANTLAREADVIVAVGTRLQDFTTSSWTGFARDARIVTINAARFDAVKRGALPVVGDALAALTDLGASLHGWQVDAEWSGRALTERTRWDQHIQALRTGTSGEQLTYAQVVGVVNEASGIDDYVLAASGGIPGELHGGWRTPGVPTGSTVDLEYGFSCMGYELAGPWGAAMARARTHPDGLVTALLGDGSYLMLNSELYSAAFTGTPFVAVVCDNGGYAVIHRLQTGQGAPGFNNLFAHSSGPGAEGLRVDFVAHARSLGCEVEDVAVDATLEDLRIAYARARKTAMSVRRPVVLVCRTHPSRWTESGAWWELGVPASLDGHVSFEQGKSEQLRWLRGS